MALPQSILQRGSRASQPAASAVAEGTLYCVTDENYILEQSVASSWVDYSPTGGSGTVTNTGTLTANALILGNGGVDVTPMASLGTTTTVLHGNAAGAPTFGAVSLTADVSGDLPFANLAQIAGLSVLGVTGSSTADVAAITATSDGQVLRRRSSSVVEFAAVDSTGAVGSEPASPAAGDLYWPNNGFVANRYSGSAWVPWGPNFPFTNPSLASISTWVNQGGASVDTTYGGIYLTAPAGAGDSVRARVKTAPSTPYVITAAFLMNYPAVNYPSAGLLFRDSASGKLATFSFGASATYYSLGVSKYTNATTFSANYTAVAWWSASSPVWLRIADNGVSRICSYSADGQHWQVLHTVGRTDFLTADQVGFYANANNATYPADLTLLSWKET